MRRGSPACPESNKDGPRPALEKSAPLGSLAGCGGFGGEALGNFGGGAAVSVVEKMAADTLGACGNKQVRPVTPTLEEAPEVFAA